MTPLGYGGDTPVIALLLTRGPYASGGYEVVESGRARWRSGFTHVAAGRDRSTAQGGLCGSYGDRPVNTELASALPAPLKAEGDIDLVKTGFHCNSRWGADAYCAPRSSPRVASATGGSSLHARLLEARRPPRRTAYEMSFSRARKSPRTSTGAGGWQRQKSRPPARPTDKQKAPAMKRPWQIRKARPERDQAPTKEGDAARSLTVKGTGTRRPPHLGHLVDQPPGYAVSVDGVDFYCGPALDPAALAPAGKAVAL